MAISKEFGFSLPRQYSVRRSQNPSLRRISANRPILGSVLGPLFKKSRDTVFAALLLATALAFIWICRTYGPTSISQWFVSLSFEKPGDFALLLAAVFSALILHELGHLLAALGFEFHFLGASFGPLQIQTLHREWKFSFLPKRIFSGSISAIPSTMRRWRGAMLIVVAAGPVFTLISATMAASLGPPDNIFQIAFVQVSVLLFALGLIPNRQEARTRNDARLFLDLLFRKPGAEEMELYISLTQLVQQGIRPRDYPDKLLARLAKWHGRPESEFVFSQALVRWAIDSEQISLADEWDLHAINLAAQCDRRIQNSAFASSACFDVVFRNDLESARIKFARVDDSSLFPKCFEHRSRAAHQIALGRLHRAPAEIIRAQYSLPRGIAAYSVERMLLDRLHMKVLLASDLSAGTDFRTASA